jgi:putative membrane protein
MHNAGARALILPTLACVSTAAEAHVGGGLSTPDLWLAASLAIALLLYVWGARSLWHAASGHHRNLPRYAAPFALGWLLLALALLPPLASISAETFSGHMLQHEVLMVAAAPLLVLGRPLAIWAWAFPRRWRPALGRPARWQGVRAAWKFLTAPLTATVLHAVALWLWHAPPLFAAAQGDIWVHALQHAAFFFTALLFWNAVFSARDSATGASLFWLFVTMLHTGALGVLLTFSAGLWYPDAPGTAAWGLTPLEDQQLGGLIMWVPGGTVYVIAALALAARWLGGGEPRRQS